MRTQIGIVYDRVTGEVLRIIVPDEDWQLAAHANVRFGEVFHMETYLGLTGSISKDDAATIIQRVTGRMPTVPPRLNTVVDAKPIGTTRKSQS